ncbi:winged helix-turn-helix transcriptional regulator [Wenjunlia tyrosinilytica]|nr:winged helix-turn-helix transcriptional regulator [Wenjunlia tyrosinilytica]
MDTHPRSRSRNVDEECGIAQAAAVLGDWWNLLVLREVARGHVRFDVLASELSVSRKVLNERLRHLVEQEVLWRSRYLDRPPRYEYLLTGRGKALLHVLVAMQDWADRWLLGDGTLTATADGESGEAARVRALVGTAVPGDLWLTDMRGGERDVVAPGATATVLFTFPATGITLDVPGAAGCTLENRLFRDAWPTFERVGAAVVGVSTQEPAEQAAFAAAECVPFPLLSDEHLRLAAALRLPTFRAGQRFRLKRLVLVIDSERVVRRALYPVMDIPSAVDEALRTAVELGGKPGARPGGKPDGRPKGRTATRPG